MPTTAAALRNTHAFRSIAAVLAADPDGRHYGRPTSKMANVRPAVMYPLLDRMLADGWITDAWEDPEIAESEDRNPCRYYLVTELGRTHLAAEAARDE